VLDYAPKVLVSIGGDGTHSEIVNGLMACSAGARSEVRLGFVHLGTGGDFARVLGIRELKIREQLDIIKGNISLISDVGRVDYYDKKKKISRYFLNMAAAGIGGQICYNVNNSWYKGWLGGTGSFYLGTVGATFTYKDTPGLFKFYDELIPESELRPLQDEDMEECLGGRQIQGHLQGKQGQWQLGNVHNLYCAKGQYQGGGMWITPRGSLQSGYFEVAVMHDVGVVKTLTGLRNNIYTGTMAENCPDVFKLYHRVRRVKLLPLGPDIRLEVDGETPGIVPAVWTCLPGELRLIVDRKCKSDDDARLAALQLLYEEEEKEL